MEILGLALMGIGIALCLLVHFKRFYEQKRAAESFRVEIQNNPKLEDTSKRNEAIISGLENFLKSSRFYEMTGKRGDDKIYRYILNSGKLYQFDSFLSPNNLKIGIDEDFLFFNGMAYMRVTNTEEFSKKFISEVSVAA